MKIGIMSFAHHHGEAYIQNLRRIAEVTWIGAADDDPVRGKQLAEGSGAQFYSSYRELLEQKPDGAIVCSENARHRPLVEMAASAGIHVMCEKPLATTLKDARAIVDACEQAGVRLMTAFPMRFSPPVISIKSQLDAGEFGQVFCFNATNQGELPLKYRAWFVDRELAGGGAVMDHTVHLVDVMRWFLGEEVAEVYAQTNKIFHADEVEVETGGLEMITFQNGVFASIDASWSRPDFWPTWGGLTFEMVTERGAVIVNGFRQNVTVYSGQSQRPSWMFYGTDINQAMVQEFVNVVREDRTPKVTGMDGYRAVEVALAAYESAARGQPVKIV